SVGARNREQAKEGAPGLAARLRELVERGKDFEGGALDDEERAGYRTTIALAERYAAEADSLEVLPPTRTVDDRLTLRLGRRAVEVLHLGGGHTRADLVVHLPEEGVVIAGDLVVWPVPLVGSTSYPAAYAASLERLLALRPRVIVPGHGPVMRDDAHVRATLRLLRSLVAQTRAAVARGETLEEARRRVDLEPSRREIAGGSALRSFVFQSYVTGPGVAAAYREAKAGR
ncbi:MAG TPA: MBL fold metallo-hydrolase, partial [Longimicrobium sp.]|nr:MBL fold metallo-hydrolase [Longimicrobium sp.]